MLKSHLLRSLAILSLLLFTSRAHAQETLRQYLSGKGADDAIPWQFQCNAGRNANIPSTIKVPSNWELQGFGTFSYGRDATFPHVTGQYKHNFTVPAEWSNRRVFLTFEGVMTDTQAKVNGESAGPMHQGGYYCFKYDVTKLVKFGQDNLLEVTVDDESANKSVNNAERRADYWNYAGIFRPVYLEAVPQQYIDRVAIDAKADGSITADVYLGDALTDAARSPWLQAQVLDLQGNPVGDVFPSPGVPAESPAHLSGKINSPRQWTAETPNLYQLEVRLGVGPTTLHTIRQRFGFRTIEVRPGDGVYVNGTRIMFKGTARHTFWPDNGRASSVALSRADIQIMHEMNMNAVRSSHYPPDSHFLDACDEMGMYVLDELAGWHQSYDTPTGARLISEMIPHDVNHPSILFWDNGNEGGWNRANDGEFQKYDPQKRTVLHPWEKLGDVNTKHYPSYALFSQLCADTTVFFPTEMLHGLYDGGLGAGLEDYWKVARASKVSAGGFMWVFADETVRRPDLNNILDTHGNMAPDGILGPYHEKEGSFYTIKQVWSPLVITQNKIPLDFTGSIELENCYDFTSAEQCAFTWELRKFNGPAQAAGFAVLSKGSTKPQAPIVPHQKGNLKLDLPGNWRSADALALTATDPTGREVFTWVMPIAADQSKQYLLALNGTLESLTSAPNSSAVALASTDDAATFTAGDLKLVVNKKTGELSSVSRAGKSFSLSNGPRLATGEGTLESIGIHPEGNDQVINATYTGNLKSVNWRIRSNGWVTLDYAYNLSGPHDFFGVSFDYPETNVKSKKWLGNGPYRVWENRLLGPTLGVWENDYNDTMTGHSTWKYPEFKGYFADVKWMQLQTTEGPITALVHSNDLFVQVLSPTFPPKDLVGNTGVNFPKAGLSFLNAIPPTGSKFVKADTFGPQSQMPIAKGDYTGSISLYFGDLK